MGSPRSLGNDIPAGASQAGPAHDAGPPPPGDPPPPPGDPQPSSKFWPSGTFMKTVQRSGDLYSSIAVFLLIVIIGTILALVGRPSAIPGEKAALQRPAPTPARGCRAIGLSARAAKTAAPVKVDPASGPNATLKILIGRNGERVRRHSAPLAIAKGRLCPGIVLATTASDFVRAGDGQALRASQVSTWARVDKYGTHVTIFVLVAPLHGEPSGFGGYSGTVALNDPRAAGGSLPVHVDVQYSNLYLVLAFSFLAAFGGFTWAWFIHAINKKDPRNTGNQPILRNLVLRLAVLLAAAIPVVKLQVLTNPDWQGSLGQFIALATIVGGAAIAATPTLRALVLPASVTGDTSSG